MARVVKIFQVRNLKTEEDEKKVKKILNSLSGIVRVDPMGKFGVVELEYEDALVDRETIKDELANHGYEMIY
ncbi:hypothetical protein AT15_08425 [Kosmotoga arenicorallina S304]|uniref:HMA domain-containing protein n=1 Tax=Kosmotoga arenicorallina S304 TaxID=1453497 RepID=A0A176K1K3_9BACT|nr:hypothetical protein [Kosmotoga arenicorallina]OAA30991.1 hypothetical protein AT15_08425 [Kosmotoga arenicorallina S304]